jgi:hypothetical protein
MGDCVGALGDILIVLRFALIIADVRVVHPPSANALSAAAATIGARCDKLKRASYSRVEPCGYPFVPFSIESYGRLGVPAMKLSHDLSDEAASPGTNFSRASFVAGALRELRVGLWRGNCAMYRANAGFLARVTGRSLCTGMVSQPDEVVCLCWECVVFCSWCSDSVILRESLICGQCCVLLVFPCKNISPRYILPYAPGKLQMESKTEGCLYPCGGDI